ncbi:MAG: ATP-dependent zinc metalloprotease FtsH [Flavobacteriales bacterium]|jgi:cell division protease FtsH|nr:ATP-dependent zinc metalloprotease FtsH [Flavobacteriales bacterium]
MEPNQNKKNNKPQKRNSFNIYWFYTIVAVFIIAYQIYSLNTSNKDWSWKQLKTALESNEVKGIELRNRTVAYIKIKREALESEPYKKIVKRNSLSAPYHFQYTIGDIRTFTERVQEAQKDTKEEEKIYVDYVNVENVLDTFLSWLPLLIFIGFIVFMMRRMGGSGAGGPGGQIFNIGKSKAQVFDEKKKIETTFKDVAGLEGAKEEVQEIVNFLKNPDKYTSLGGKIPKGALLVGPPGTGKTLLAKAVAGEAGVPFFSLSGSDFVEMFVGVGASRVRDLFQRAKEKSPSIIFIDEIDAIGRARGKNAMTGGNDERENTLNQLLTEMDGFGTKNHVIVLAATNRADVLDKALVRAGRFDRQIYVDLPELNERKEIFEVHTKSLKVEDNLDLDFLAKQTPGFSGADIANMCNEAALIAARKDKKQINKQDFLDAVDRIIGGLEKRNKIISKSEKEVIAIHEAGHAVASWMSEFAAPLVKVTIVPRGKSLGAAWYLPEERQITTTEQMLHEMRATLGGRAAEDIIFNKISTGALSDLEKVTKQAQAMVSIYGLSDKIGNVSYYDSSGQQSGFTKPFSEETARIIDQEIKDIIQQQYEFTKKILQENVAGLKQIAKLLLDNEVIFKEDLEKVLGTRQSSEYNSIFPTEKIEENNTEEKPKIDEGEAERE